MYHERSGRALRSKPGRHIESKLNRHNMKSANAPCPPDLIGRTALGAFELQRSIGEGGFATAYLARQLYVERQAVVKIAHPDLMHGARGEAVRRAFQTEARALGRLAHPHVVTLYLVGEEGGLPAIAMEYVNGMSLGRLFHHHPTLNVHWMTQLFEQLISALVMLRRARIVHRDITPDNVLVEIDADTHHLNVKLFDFGLALLDGEQPRRSGVTGTPRYIAYEQFQGAASDKTDVFNLGALMWWAFTGEEFLAEANDLSSTLLLQQCQPRRPLGQDGRLLPREIEELLAQMLSPNPARRPGIHDVQRRWPELMRRWAEHHREGRRRQQRRSSEIPCIEPTPPTQEGPTTTPPCSVEQAHPHSVR